MPMPEPRRPSGANVPAGVKDRRDHGVQRRLVDVPLVEPVRADRRARVHRRDVRGRGGGELRGERRDRRRPQQRVVRVALDEAHAEGVEQHDGDAVDPLRRPGAGAGSRRPSPGPGEVSAGSLSPHLH